MIDGSLLRQWRERLDDFARSGLSVERWCAAQGVPSHRYYYWRSKLAKSQAPPSDESVDWLAMPVCTSAQVSASLTVRIGAAAIDVAPGFDAALLRDVVAALTPPEC